MDSKELSLFHLIRPHKTVSGKAPLLIMLHGYGSNEEDLFSFAEELPDELFIISVRAPYPMQPYGNAWYAIHWGNTGAKFSDDQQAILSREKISNFIDEAVAAYPVAATNINLLGFSQGTILSFAVALSYPEKVKNVIGLSGYINEGILTEDYKNKDFSRLSVYNSHGSLDQVIPISWARKNKPLLDSLGIENKYSEFPVGHGVSPQNLLEVKVWLREYL